MSTLYTDGLNDKIMHKWIKNIKMMHRWLNG